MIATTGVFLDAALRYAEMGYRVFPCAPGDKNPITDHGFHDASTDADTIERWWAKHPNANVGIATEGLAVIDIDGETNPWPGDPERMLDLAAAPMALTPRGGSHRIFRQPAGKGWRLTGTPGNASGDPRVRHGWLGKTRCYLCAALEAWQDFPR